MTSVSHRPADPRFDASYQRFARAFYDYTGIWFDASKKYFVEKRLQQRMRQTGVTTLRRYLEYVTSTRGRGELQELVNALTVNETYFFREAHQFEMLVHDVLPRCAARRRGRSIKIWSFPCSTGEEPYSLAIYLSEYWPALAHHDVEIFGADIDTSVLEQCARAHYGARSVQYLPPELKARYFHRRAGGYELASEIREAVSFGRANLSDPSTLTKYRDFDVIFCRNLLIYFDEDARRVAAEQLHAALAPEGVLFLGNSESMSHETDLFEMVRLDGGVVYRRR